MAPLNGPLIVVGGVNVDISGTTQTAMLRGDSNPGRITVTPGGVGRNIAETLARLGQKVGLLSVLGEDANADLIRRSCVQAHIDLTETEAVPGARTGTYLCLNEPDGDVYAAVSDMDIYRHLSPALIERHLSALNAASLVLIDANLPEETIAFLAERCEAPLAADPVSVKKAGRLKSALPRLVTMKPNRREAALLTGVDTSTMTGVAEAAQVLYARGVRHVFISLGSDGVYYEDGTSRGVQPCFPGRVLNTNGCGDAFIAAALIAWLEGQDTAGMARMGQAAASVNAEADTAVSPQLSLDSIRRRLESGAANE